MEVRLAKAEGGKCQEALRKEKNVTNWKIKRVQCGCKSELAKWQEAREAKRLGSHENFQAMRDFWIIFQVIEGNQ